MLELGIVMLIAVEFDMEVFYSGTTGFEPYPKLTYPWILIV